MLANWLIATSALIILALGVIHLVYTLFTAKLQPRDSHLQARMAESHLNITRETTIWRTWIGFNASHSLGAILFGLVYGYLALAQDKLLFASVYLQALGFVFLASLAVLGWRYWFSVPFRGIVISLVAFVAGLVVAHT